MKIELVVIGKNKESYVQTGIDEFSKRVSRYYPFKVTYLEMPKKKSTLPKEKLLEEEFMLIDQYTGTGDILVLLDEQGKKLNSRSFAKQLDNLLTISSGRILFVIGGAYGFHNYLYQKAYTKISLSEMTFSHQLIRLIFLEQLYRACTILHNHPYHND